MRSSTQQQQQQHDCGSARVHLFLALANDSPLQREGCGPGTGTSGGDACSVDGFVSFFPKEFVKGVLVQDMMRPKVMPSCPVEFASSWNTIPQYTRWSQCSRMIRAAEDAQGWSYSWIIRWRVDYRPDKPLPHISHVFWDSGLEAEEGGLRSEDDVFEADGRGYLAGAGWMVSAPGDAPGDGPHSAAAAVYVPHIPGYDRVFTHHTWPVADFFSFIPRPLMKAMLEDIERSVWSCHLIADAVALCSPQVAHQFEHVTGRQSSLWAECVYTLHLRLSRITAVPMPSAAGFGWSKVSWASDGGLVLLSQTADKAVNITSLT